jgi:cell wall-associated NlpC family hydrolase
MEFVNILASCNQTLGTCCSDSGTVKILSIYNSVFTIIQIIVPIILLVMATYQLTIMVTQPDDKKNMSTLTNKFLAAAIVFLLPIVLNLVLSIVDTESNIGKFDTIACLKEAQKSASTIEYNTSGDNSEDTEGNVSLLIGSEFHGTNENPNSGSGTYSNGSSSSSSSSVETTSDGKKVVEYAKKFLGKGYFLGGTWDGSPNYTPTDCAGFVKGVYTHFGYNNLPRASFSYPNNSVEEVSESNLKAGDIAVYQGHVAMLTGNGKEIIHAASPTQGIVTSNSYALPGMPVKAFYHVKGMN